MTQHIRTGIYDKNGRELCVGDRIVILLNGPGTKREYWNPEYEVIWKAPAFGVKYVGGGKNSDTATWYFGLGTKQGSEKLETLIAAPQSDVPPIGLDPTISELIAAMDEANASPKGYELPHRVYHAYMNLNRGAVPAMRPIKVVDEIHWIVAVTKVFPGDIVAEEYAVDGVPDAQDALSAVPSLKRVLDLLVARVTDKDYIGPSKHFDPEAEVILTSSFKYVLAYYAALQAPDSLEDVISRLLDWQPLAHMNDAERLWQRLESTTGLTITEMKESLRKALS